MKYSVSLHHKCVCAYGVRVYLLVVRKVMAGSAEESPQLRFGLRKVHGRSQMTCRSRVLQRTACFCKFDP